MPLTPKAIAWLEDRRLDPEAADRLGWAATGDALSIPYLENGQVVNVKFRALGEKKFWMREGGKLCLWNQDVLHDESLGDTPIVITEGEMDALAAIQCGFVRSVSLPNGGDNSDGEGAWPWLEPILPALRKCRRVILAVDRDDPGLRAGQRLVNAIGRARCYWAAYPEGMKDLNEVLMGEDGAQGLAKALNEAKAEHIGGVGRLSTLPPIPPATAYSTGIDELDPHYKIRLGDFCVVTGIPGHGKTTLINDLVCRVAERHGWTVAIASFEQPPQTEQRRALRTWFTTAPPGSIFHETHLAEADAWIERHFVFITAEGDDLIDLEYVLQRIETAALRFGAKLVVIDPWNEIDHARDRYQSETEYTGMAIKELKHLANRLSIHLIVVAHPTKPQFAGKLKCPSPYDISGSSHWFNKPDVCIAVWRETDKWGHANNNETEIRVQKSRYWDQIGKPGRVNLWFDAGINRYRSLGELEAAS